MDGWDGIALIPHQILNFTADLINVNSSTGLPLKKGYPLFLTLGGSLTW